MRSQFDDDGGMRPDVQEVVDQVSRTFRNNVKKIGPIILVVLLLILAVLGFYEVDPGQVGVVRTFGAVSGQTGPGLHYRIPFVQQKDVVNVEKVRRIEVGFRGEERRKDEALMLTGDENIVEAQMIVQYRVNDPVKFLFRLREPEKALHATAEVALRSMVGKTKIDDLLTTGRDRLQVDTMKELQRLMDEYQSGLEITEVKLQTVDAPEQVKEAFNDVVRAREEREKLINKAKGYEAEQLPSARGEARKMEQAAEAYKEERVLRAEGDAAKFAAIRREYESAKEVTRQRMYLETMERVLRGIDKKVVIDGDVADGTLPVLPLGGRAVVGAGQQGGQ